MKAPIVTGDVFETKEGSRCQVIEYKNSQEITVMFLDDNKHTLAVRAHNLRTGSVKNPYHPSVFGVGYIGVGKHKTSERGRDTELYGRWKAILQRCYSDKWQSKYPTYRGCTVSKEWLNFQTFADWATSQIGFGEHGWQIDKDFLVVGNKHYGPETCSIIPQRINKLMVGTDGGNGLPRGVSWHSRYNSYGVVCRDGRDRNVFLGRFKDISEAFLVYKNFKEKVIRDAANEFREILDPRVYNSLLSYEVPGP